VNHATVRTRTEICQRDGTPVRVWSASCIFSVRTPYQHEQSLTSNNGSTTSKDPGGLKLIVSGWCGAAVSAAAAEP
jgi:hypothetical protein